MTISPNSCNSGRLDSVETKNVVTSASRNEHASQDGNQRRVERLATARRDILSGPIPRTMLKLALPPVGEQLALILTGTVQLFYVSHLGTDAIAAFTLVSPMLMLMTMMCVSGIGGGVASALGRAIGAGRQTDANAIIFHAVIIAIVFGFVFTGGLIVIGPGLYRWLGGGGKALDEALMYSSSLFAAAVPLWIVGLLSAALRGAGNVRFPALITVLGTVVTIPLTHVFIFGVGPFHGLGIIGVGTAVNAYYTIAAIVVLWYMIRGRYGLTLRYCRLEFQLFREILGVGFVSALGTLQFSMTAILVTGAVGRFGTNALAGYGICSRLDLSLISVLSGFGTAVLTMVATNVGAGNYDRTRSIVWIGTFASASFAGMVGALVALFPMLWLGLYTQDSGPIEAGSIYLRTVGPSYGAVGIAVVLGFVSVGGGRPIWSLLAGTVRLIVAAGVGSLAVMEFKIGLMTLALIIASSSILSALFCLGATLSGVMWRTTTVKLSASS
jgi:putative MATE family efflux protein